MHHGILQSSGEIALAFDILLVLTLLRGHSHYGKIVGKLKILCLFGYMNMRMW